MLQLPRDRVGEQGGGSHEHRDDTAINVDAIVDRAHIRFDEQRSQVPVALRHWQEPDQIRSLEPVRQGRQLRVGRKGARLAALGIDREQPAALVVERGSRDVFVGLEGTEHRFGVVRVVEGKRRGRVRGNRPAQRVQLLAAALPERDEIVGEQRRGRQQHHGTGRQQHHADELSANRGAHVSRLRRCR